jgi:antitoxin ParD1/3/4
LTNIGKNCHDVFFGFLGDTTMATMNISLPDPMRDWVQSQIEDGMYASSSDYVRDLIRRDQGNRRQQRLLQAAITEGLASGISDRSMEDVLKEAQARLAGLNAD